MCSFLSISYSFTVGLPGSGKQLEELRPAIRLAGKVIEVAAVR